MKFIKQLLDEDGSKKSVSRKAAKAVYHRDYVKTKKKPYRKYDPEDHKRVSESYETMSLAQLKQELEHAREDLQMATEVGEDQETIDYIRNDISCLEDQLEAIKFHAPRDERGNMQSEGVFDFAIGAGKHVGDKIKQGLDNTVAAGKAASAQGDLTRNLQSLAKLLVTYDKLKPAQPRVEPVDAEQQAAPEQPAVQPEQDRNIGGTVDAFRTTTKPRTRVGGKYGPEHVFSSYLQTLDSEDFLSEGVWDFIKGAGKHAAGAIGQATRGAVDAGKQASTGADLERTKAEAQQLVKQIVQQLGGLGPQAGQMLAQAAEKACGPQSKRCLAVITNAAKKLGVQL